MAMVVSGCERLLCLQASAFDRAVRANNLPVFDLLGRLVGPVSTQAWAVTESSTPSAVDAAQRELEAAAARMHIAGLGTWTGV